MKEFAQRCQEFRVRAGLSQRALAKRSGVSFRQIQRIEAGECEPSLSLANRLLSVFGHELRVSDRTPDWTLLQSRGLAIQTSESLKTAEALSEDPLGPLVKAMEFIFDQRDDPHWARHQDAIKAYVLCLQTHYPSRFQQLKNMTKPRWLAALKLKVISGRDIKLRNLTLGLMSQRLSSR